MRLFPLLFVPLLFVPACTSSTISVGDGADTGTPDTDTDTDTAPPTTVAAANLAWTLHEDVESLVYASWTQDGDAPVHVEYSFDEGVWMSSPSFAGVAGENQQLLAGIPFDTAATWRVAIEGGEDYDGPAIQTGEFPDDMPEPALTVSDESAWLPGANYLLTSINEHRGGWTGGTYWTFILDRKARVVWAQYAPERNWTLYAQVALDGQGFYWDEATYWSDYDDGRDSKIHQTWLDEEIRVFDTPGLHHAWVQLPDGTITWGSQDHGGGEALVERAPGQTDETVVWTCDNWPGSDQERSCESNGIFYVEETDTYLYSFYTNNSIAEVDRATGETLWWAGEVRDGFEFSPSDAQFSWQHGITYTDTGTLLVSTEWPYNAREQTTVLAEYEVDRDAGTLTYVWGSDSEVYASTNGDAWRLDNGNTLHMVGAASVIREVDPAGDDVWRVEFDDDYLLGRGEFIEDLYTLVKPRE